MAFVNQQSLFPVVPGSQQIAVPATKIEEILIESALYMNIVPVDLARCRFPGRDVGGGGIKALLAAMDNMVLHPLFSRRIVVKCPDQSMLFALEPFEGLVGVMLCR